MKITNLITEITKHEKALHKAKLIFKAIGNGVIKIKVSGAREISIQYKIKGFSNNSQPEIVDMIVHQGRETKHVGKIRASMLEYSFPDEEFGISAQYYNMEKRRRPLEIPWRDLINNQLQKKFKSFGVVLDEIPIVRYVGKDTSDY